MKIINNKEQLNELKHMCQLSISILVDVKSRTKQPTSFVETVLQFFFLAQDVSVPTDSDSIVLLDLPVAQFVVELVGGGVQRACHWVLLVTVVVIENGGLADGHADDRAAVLVSVSGPPVAVAALGPQQDGGDVVDLVRGLSAGAFLRDAATFAPSMAGVQD